MKTWTNPTVEELDVKLTSFFWSWWQVEEANGKWDDSLIHGHAPAPGHGNGDGNGDGNDGGDQGGSGENEGGFGSES